MGLVPFITRAYDATSSFELKESSSFLNRSICAFLTAQKGYQSSGAEDKDDKPFAAQHSFSWHADKP